MKNLGFWGWSLFTVIGLTFVTAQVASAADPKVGQAPPLLQAVKLLQAPEGTTLDAASLKGKVVVLEFWATWCGPCVAAIPHLNELSDKFKGKPVQFVAITAEDEATIKPFLGKRPIHAWVALDTDRAMNTAYGVTAIPHTVVLDKEGRIAAITYPSSLTAGHIETLLAGGKLDLPQPGAGESTVPNKRADEKPPLFQVVVRESTHTNASCGTGGGRLTARAYTVRDILTFAFEENSVRIQTNAPLPEGLFDFEITQPSGSQEGLTNLLQAALRSAFGLAGVRETNTVDVFLLKVRSTNAPGLVVSPTPSGSFHYGPGDIGGMDVSMTALANALEASLKTPVIDETGLTNQFDITLKWSQESRNQPNPEGLKKALREQLGLELEAARRPIPMVRIDRVEGWQPQTKARRKGH